MAVSESQFLDAALDAARHGFAVFPVAPRGKVPAVKGWQHSATSDPESIARIWTLLPESNIGIACGHGLTVFDADSRAGEDALRELGMPSETTTVQGRRGKHYYLRGDGATRTGILPGVDVRGTGGLVVGAGSVHATGVEYRYVVSPDEALPAPMPPELTALFSSKNALRTHAISPICTSSTAPILRGSRNGTLFGYAQAMHTSGVSADAILAALHAVNAERCSPALLDEEIGCIVASAVRYAATPWKSDIFGFSCDPRLKSTERHLLLALTRYANLKGECFPGYDQLREDTGINRNALGRAINGLEAAGRIKVERGNQTRSNKYRLLPYSGKAA